MGFPGGKHANCFREGICHFSLQRCIFYNFLFLLKYFGRSTGREHMEFSKEELNVWNVEKLRKYLKERSIVITGDTRKRDLIMSLQSTALHIL